MHLRVKEKPINRVSLGMAYVVCVFGAPGDTSSESEGILVFLRDA